MGAATTNALEASAKALDAQSGVDLTVAAELFAVARALDGSPALASALADKAAAPEAREKVVAAVFGSLAPATVALVSAVVAQRWSQTDDLVDAIEELGIRAASVSSADADVEGELFGVTRVVAQNPQLELALGSRLGDDAKKADLVRSLFAVSTSEATVLIVSELVRLPRERRVRQLLTRAEKIVAAQRGRSVATVTTAKPLSAAQAEKLASILSARYNTPVTLNPVVDPAVVGGLRVQIADDVIDASIAARLADLRTRLAG